MSLLLDKFKIIGLIVIYVLLPITAFAAVAPVAVLPLLDLSRSANGINIPLTGYLIDRLNKGGTQTVSLDTIISFMHHNRIRVAGEVETYHVKKAEEDLGAAFVLYGSILQNREEPTPTLGLVLNLLRTYDSQIIWTYSATFSKEDFRKPLEIGEPSSTLELQALLVEQIMSFWPSDMVNPELQGATSIDTILLEPKKVKPGDEIQGQVRLRNLSKGDTPPKVFFKSDEQVHAGTLLPSGDGYEATWIAGEKDGRFPVTLLIEWPLYGRIENLEIGSYLVDGQAPLLELELKGQVGPEDAPVFRDKVIVIPKMIVRKPISRWRIKFTNSSDVVVASQEEDGTLPERFTWYGQNFFGGREVAGNYQVLLDIWDEAGNTSSASMDFELSRMAPAVALSAEKKEQGVVVDLEQKSKVPLAYWRLEMWSDEGRLLKSAEGKELPIQIDVELQEDESDRKIEGILVTEDVLGNKSLKKVPDLFPKIEEEAAKEEESKTATKSWVDDF